MVIPLSRIGKHLGVKPAINQPSWVYTYPGHLPPVSNVNFQPTSTGIVYPRIPYPEKNVYTMG